MQPISVSLWFETEAQTQGAADFYTSIFKNSKIKGTTYYTGDGPKPKGEVLTIDFEINGIGVTALNGGPEFKFNEAISLVANCDTQAEVDEVWEKLLRGGGKPVQCGWLTDKFGVSWQVVPVPFLKMLQDKDQAKVARAMAAMMKMVKLDLPALQRAFDGK
jgi:two-component system sensor histidine kinase QseC